MPDSDLVQLRSYPIGANDVGLLVPVGKSHSFKVESSCETSVDHRILKKACVKNRLHHSPIEHRHLSSRVSHPLELFQVAFGRPGTVVGDVHNLLAQAVDQEVDHFGRTLGHGVPMVLLKA